MYVLENLHWFVLLIGALVFFHELGHFIFAKLFDVKVQRFSLGFGPKLFGFVRGETEYWVSLLPLGGYVKMLGESPAMDVPQEDLARALHSKPVWKRALILLAGPGFNFLLAFVVYAAMFVGTNTFGDTRLGVVTENEPAWRAGLRPGDKVLTIDGTAARDWEKLRVEIASRPNTALPLTYERQGQVFSTNVVSEAWEQKNVFQESESRGKVGISLQFVKPIIAVVDGTSPAAQAGLQTGDIITAVGETKVMAWHEVKAAVLAAGSPLPLTIQRQGQELKVNVPEVPFPEAFIGDDGFSTANTKTGYTGIVTKDSLVSKVEAATPAALSGIEPGDRLMRVVIKTPDGQLISRPIGVWGIDLAAFSGLDARSDIELQLQRGSQVVQTKLKLMARDEADELKNVRTVYVFGATNDPECMGTYTYERHVGVAEALQEAGRQVANDATLIARGIGKLIKGDLPLDAMGGPIMLFVIAEKSAKRGAQVFLRTMAVISVNLGLVNLLPVPALDGGHLMFCAFEAIRRRPPSYRVREIANAVGLVLLIVLMILAFKNDILRYVLG